MFWQKAAEISDLKDQITDLELHAVGRTSTITRLEKEKDELDASVLNIARVAEQKTEQYDTLNAAFQDVAKKNCDLNVVAAELRLQLDASDDHLGETLEMRDTLNDENADLCRKLELLEAVLGQLTVVVKLPGKKRK